MVRNFDELKSIGRARKSRAKSCSLIIHSISRWPRKVAAGMPTAKQSFIAATARARQRDSERWRALIRSVGGADYRLPHTGQTKYANDAPKIPARRGHSGGCRTDCRTCPQGSVRMNLLLTPQTTTRCGELQRDRRYERKRTSGTGRDRFRVISIRGISERARSMTARASRSRWRRRTDSKTRLRSANERSA